MKVLWLLGGLYILNISDLVFTGILLGSGKFAEANPVMAIWMTRPIAVFLVKIVFMGLLILWLLFRMKKATGKQLRISAVIIGILAGFYLIVNAMHVYWTIREIL